MQLEIKLQNRPAMAACIVGILGVYFSDSGISYLRVLAFMSVSCFLLEFNELHTLAYTSQYAFTALFFALVLYNCSHALLLKTYATNLLIMKAPGLVSSCITLALYLQSYTHHYKYLSQPKKLIRNLILQIFSAFTCFTAISAVAFYTLPPALVPIGVFIGATTSFWIIIQPITSSSNEIDDMIGYVSWMFLFLCLSVPAILNFVYSFASNSAVLLETVLFLALSIFGSFFVESWTKKFYGIEHLTPEKLSNKLTMALIGLILTFIFFYLVSSERRDNLFIKQPPIITFTLIIIYSVSCYVGSIKQKHFTTKIVCFSLAFVAISTITDSKEINISTMILFASLSYLFDGSTDLEELIALSSALIFSTNTVLGQYWFFRLSIAAVLAALLCFAKISALVTEIDQFSGYRISASYLIFMLCYSLSIPDFIQKSDIFNCYMAGTVSCVILSRKAMNDNSIPVFFENALYFAAASIIIMTVSNSFTGKLFIFFSSVFFGFTPYILRLTQKSAKLFNLSYMISLAICVITFFTKLWIYVASVILALYYPQISFDDEVNWLYTLDTVTSTSRIIIFKLYLSLVLFGVFLAALQHFSQQNIFPVITIIVTSLYGLCSNLPSLVTFSTNFTGESLLLSPNTLSIALLALPLIGITLSAVSLMGRISYSHTLDYIIGSIPLQAFSYLLVPISGKFTSFTSTILFVLLIIILVIIGYASSTFSFLFSIFLSIYYFQYFILGLEVIYPEFLYALTMILPMTGYSPFIIIPATVSLHMSNRSYISATIIGQTSILSLIPWRMIMDISYSFGTIVESELKIVSGTYLLVALIPAYIMFYYKRRAALIYSTIFALISLSFSQIIVSTAFSSIAVAAILSSQKLDLFE